MRGMLNVPSVTNIIKTSKNSQESHAMTKNVLTDDIHSQNGKIALQHFHSQSTLKMRQRPKSGAARISSSAMLIVRAQ